MQLLLRKIFALWLFCPLASWAQQRVSGRPAEMGTGPARRRRPRCLGGARPSTRSVRSAGKRPD